MRVAWLPCVLFIAMTAIGLGALAVSGLAAVREFRVFAAAGVLMTLCGLLVLIPGFLRWKLVARPSSSTRAPWMIWESF
ncbi:MAG TPA: hypothetical protein DDZ51_29135 [Planctomycetaceae bacterium]|nr:hypothetical protein [Planctomycetaceae bacterium]